jgi:hypothetical protein
MIEVVQLADRAGELDEYLTQQARERGTPNPKMSGLGKVSKAKVLFSLGACLGSFERRRGEGPRQGRHQDNGRDKDYWGFWVQIDWRPKSMSKPNGLATASTKTGEIKNDLAPFGSPQDGVGRPEFGFRGFAAWTEEQ